MAKNKTTAVTSSTDWEYILDDKYIEDMSRYFKKTSADAQNDLDALISYLYKVCISGIVEGETAEALRAFYERAASLRSLISELGTIAEQYCDDLLSSTDAADRNLYN